MKRCVSLAALLVAGACSTTGTNGSDTETGKSDAEEELQFDDIGLFDTPGGRIEIVSEDGEDRGISLEVPGVIESTITLIPAAPNGELVSLHVAHGEHESFDETTEFLWSSSKDEREFRRETGEPGIQPLTLLVKAPEGVRSRVLVDVYFPNDNLWPNRRLKDLAEAEPNNTAAKCQEIDTVGRFVGWKIGANLGQDDVDCFAFQNDTYSIRLDLVDGGANHELTLCERGHLDDCLDSGGTAAHYLPRRSSDDEPTTYLLFVRSKDGKSGDYVIDASGIDRSSD